VLRAVRGLVQPVAAPVGDPALGVAHDLWAAEPGSQQFVREGDPVPHPLVGFSAPAGVAEQQVLQPATRRFALGGSRGLAAHHLLDEQTHRLLVVLDVAPAVERLVQGVEVVAGLELEIGYDDAVHTARLEHPVHLGEETGHRVAVDVLEDV